MIPRTIFAEEHRIFREQCRSLFEKEFVPFHTEWERDGIVPRAVWKLMGGAGLLCTSVPEQDGGLGADKLTAVVMLEELSDLGLMGMALNFAMHSEIVTPYLLKYGSQQQKERWLPALIAGERIGALAMTEPAAGSDLQRMKTVARREGDGSDCDERHGWTVAWLATGLEGFDDEHAAATAGARLGEWLGCRWIDPDGRGGCDGSPWAVRG
jgi:acyl-CoA dehydrogenase